MGNFGYDPRLAICGIAVLPVLLWWFRQEGSNHLKWFGYYMIAFFIHGSLELLGIINPTILRYIFELPLIFLYLTLDKTNLKRYEGRWLIVPLVIVSAISAIQTSVIMLVLFLLYFLEIFMLLLYYRNTYKEDEAVYLNKLFSYLAISQIGAAIIKYFMVGVTEPYIGSMSSHEGGITTIFTLVMFCYSLEQYFITKDKKFILYAVGFTFFGVVGGKRVLAFIIPTFYFVVLIIHSYFEGSLSNNIKKTIFGLIAMPFLFVILCILNPSFNPENKVGGSFDLEYVLEYSDKYNNGGFGGDDEAGRANAMSIVHDKMLNDDFFHILFGYGSGSMIASSYNSQSYGSEAYMKKFGVGYSMGIGYLTLLAQIGFIGVFLYFFIFIKILVDMSKRLKLYYEYMNKDDVSNCIIGIVTTLVIIILSFTYNSTSFYFNCASVLNMWFISRAYITLDQIEDSFEEEEIS